MKWTKRWKKHHMDDSYTEFVRTKLAAIPPVGITRDVPIIDGLFPHQIALVRWALRRGRAAIFADTGLGKTRMQIAWADAVRREEGHDVLILAPLAVAQQTAAEAESVGVTVNHAHDASEVKHGITITNYDRLHKFDTSRFGAVVLDESSVIKHHNSKTLQALLDAFARTPYRLCATATPAPNDWTELGTHAEFLGIRSRAEMLAEFFVHDGGETQTWRLKGHAKHAFWQWVATWGAMLRSPSDLGFDASAYRLPPLHVHKHTVKADNSTVTPGMLFALEATDLMERRNARKDSLDARVRACAEMVNDSDEPWIIWCDLNAEGDALRAAIPDAVEIRGSDTAIDKERKLIDFAGGKIRVLVTKPSIAGWGLNWQHCRNVGFVGVTDSWESYYQAVRRCWRFGQKRDVHVHIFASEQEGSVVANLKRKEKDAIAMADALAAEVIGNVKADVLCQRRESNNYTASSKVQLPSFMRP
jgi:superfamily II DNA or RNA helicase